MPIMNQPQLLSEHVSIQIALNLHKNNKLLRSIYLEYLMAGFIEEGYAQLCSEEAEYTLRQAIESANLTRYALKQDNQATLNAKLAEIEIKGSYLFFNPRRLRYLLQLMSNFLDVFISLNLSAPALNALFSTTLNFYFSKNLRIFYIYPCVKNYLFKEIDPSYKEKFNCMIGSIHTDILYSFSGTLRSLLKNPLLNLEHSVFHFFNLDPNYNIEHFVEKYLLHHEVDSISDRIVRKFIFTKNIINLFFFIHRRMETKENLLFAFLREISTTYLAHFFETILEYTIIYGYYPLAQELIISIFPFSQYHSLISKIIQDTLFCKNFLSELLLATDPVIRFNETLHFFRWLLQTQTRLTEEILQIKHKHLIREFLSYSDYFLFYQALRFSSQSDFLRCIKHEAQRVQCWEDLLRSSYQIRIDCIPLYAAFLNKMIPNQEALTFFWEDMVIDAQSNFSLKKQLLLFNQDIHIIQSYNQHFMRKWLGIPLIETTLENFVWLNNPTLQTREKLLVHFLTKMPSLFNYPSDLNNVIAIYKNIIFNLVFDFSTTCQPEVLVWCFNFLKKNDLARSLGWTSSRALISQFMNEKSLSFIIAFFYAPAKLKGQSIFFIDLLWRFVSKYDSSKILLKNMLLGRNTLNITNPFEFTILKNHLTIYLLTWLYGHAHFIGREALQKQLLATHFVHLCSLNSDSISVHPDAYHPSHFKWLVDFSVRFGCDFWDKNRILMVLRFYFLNEQLVWENKRIFLDYFFYKLKIIYFIDLDDFFDKKVATDFLNYVIQFFSIEETKKKYLRLIFSKEWFGCMDWLLEKAVKESGLDYHQSILTTFFHLLLLLAYESYRRNDAYLPDYFRGMDWCFAAAPQYQVFSTQINQRLLLERNLDQHDVLAVFRQWTHCEQVILNLAQFEFKLKKGEKDFSQVFLIGQLPRSLKSYPLNEIILSDQARKHLIEEGFKIFQDSRNYILQFSTAILIRFLHARLESHLNELPKLSLECADLTAVDFKNPQILSYLSYFTLVSFSQANLKKVVFEHCDLSSLLLFFDQAQLQQANFSYTYLEDTVFKQSNLDGASFAYAELQDIDFTEASLKETCFNYAVLRGSEEDFLFDQACLDKSDFSNAQLSNIEFLACSLNKACFEKSQLKSVNFESANLTEVRFSGATLQEKVNFNNAILVNADFSGCNLQAAVFSGEKLNIDGLQLKNTTLTINQLFYFYQKGITDFQAIKLTGTFTQADFLSMTLDQAILSPQAITYLIEHQFMNLQSIQYKHLPALFIQKYQDYLGVKSRSRAEFFSANDMSYPASKRVCPEQSTASFSLKK